MHLGCLIGDLVVRTANQIDEGQIDDIRLIVTELLANAIQTGGRRLRLTLSVDDEGWQAI